MLFECFKDKEILFVVMKIINVEHIFLMPSKGIVSAWELTSPPATTQQFLMSPQALKILASSPRQTKCPDNPNTLNMFNNNTYTNFKAAYTRYICDGVMLENYLNHKFH